jgi:hypothetical protein
VREKFKRSTHRQRRYGPIDDFRERLNESMLTDTFKSKARMRSMRFRGLKMLMPLDVTPQGLDSTDARRKPHG